MRDPKRIDRMLTLIRAIWVSSPDMRLGQLLINVDSEVERRVWFIEDDQLEANLKRIAKEGF